VFDNVAKSASMSGTGDDQQKIADMMSEAWLAFARTGDPNSPLMPGWKPYTSIERATIVVNLVPELILDPRGKQIALLPNE
jgi:para-nitrobenzyl esterase